MTKKILAGIAALAVLAGGWFVYEIIDTDAPDEVSTSAALEQLAADSAAASGDANDRESSSAADGAAADSAAEENAAEDSGAEGSEADGAQAEPADETEAAAVAADSGVIGVWAVDDDFGEFSFSNASGSFAGFRVEKSFFSGTNATAVGRSGSVTGQLEISADTLASASIVVDMSAMESDEAARVSAIKQAIRASEHPTATFVVTEPSTLDTDALSSGATVSVSVTGDLTIAGTTRTVTVPLEATVTDSGIGLIVGTVDLVWADYGVETPQSSVADVADEGQLEFQLIVRPS